MFKRIGIIALSVLALAGAGAMGIHLTRSAVGAEVVYRITVWGWDDDVWVPLSDWPVVFNFRRDGRFEMQTNLAGEATVVLPNYLSHGWEADCYLPMFWFNCEPWDPEVAGAQPPIEVGGSVNSVTFWLASDNGR